MKTWLLIRSNIKKNRSSSITLIILIMLATIFMNIGLTVVTKLSQFVDDKKANLNGADYGAIGNKAVKEETTDIFKSLEGYQDMDAENVIYYDAVSIYNEKRDEKPQSMGLLLLDMDHERQYSLLKPIDPAGKVKENSIILPYSLKCSNDYKVGDNVVITMDKIAYEFEIYAFAEDVMFSSPMNISVYKCFAPHEKFEQVYQNVGDYNQDFYACIELKNGYSCVDFDQAFTNISSGEQSSKLQSLIRVDYASMKTGATITTSIVMSILVVFAVMIILIAIMVIRFSVVSFIEGDVKNIGSMEAIGFTQKMLRNSMMIQFLLITLAGFLLGTVASYLGGDLVNNFVSISLGLNWREKISIGILGITFAVIVIMISCVTYRVTKRLNKVTPIMALRNGTETFHFTKNYFPLATSHGSLNWVLGLKGISSNRKQNISIFIIAMFTSFSVATALSLYSNLVLSDTVFRDLIGIEQTQIGIVDKKEDYLSFFDQLEKKEGIKQTLRYSNPNLSIRYGVNEVSTTFRVCNDYSKAVTKNLAEGRYPEFDNEIAMSYRIKDRLHVKMGDVVQIVSGDTSYEYVIVGFLQHICYLGESADITESGMLRYDPSFEPRQLYLYLEDGYRVEKMIKSLETEVLDRGGSIMNIEDGFKSTLSGFNKGIRLLTAVVCIITGGITAFILFYLVKMKIAKERVTLGISKAIGYTSRQLMIQTIISFTTIIGISSVMGIILARLALNPMLTFSLSSMSSIKHTLLVMNPWIVVITLLFILAISISVTVLVSLRIRRFEPRELVVD